MNSEMNYLSPKIVDISVYFGEETLLCGVRKKSFLFDLGLLIF